MQAGNAPKQQNKYIVVPSPHTDMGCLYAAVQCSPPQISMQAARAESEMVMFGSIKAALAKANLKPSQVRVPDSIKALPLPGTSSIKYCYHAACCCGAT